MVERERATHPSLVEELEKLFSLKKTICIRIKETKGLYLQLAEHFNLQP